MKKLTLKVKGMHCHACEHLIKEALDDLGIKISDVSYEKGTVSMLFDETRVKESQIKTSIQHEGFKVVS